MRLGYGIRLGYGKRVMEEYILLSQTRYLYAVL